MTRIKKYLSIITLLSASMPATALDIISTVPNGEKVSYYADFQNFDNTFGFMGDYHSTQTLTFTSDGTVYIPNLLLRRTMPSFVKGIYDRAASTITVEAGQCVFVFPNENIPVALYALDSNGNAGPSANEFYDEPLVFDVAADGVLTLRASDRFPMFGLCNATVSDEVYQNARELSFTPTAAIDSKTVHYKYSYIYGSESEPTVTSASSYTDAMGNVWVKGLDPKYPESWIKIEKDGTGYSMPSFQTVYYFSTEDPIVFVAMRGDDVMNKLPFDIDPATMTIMSSDNTLCAGNITPDNGGSYEIYQTYRNICLEPAQFQTVKPQHPQFISYSPANSSGETEFIISAYPHDISGGMLLQDRLSFRIFVDGRPYTFTPADYRWISQPMTLVPYTYHNYNFFSQGGNDKERRYIYFNALPLNVATIGVELVYELDGFTTVSDRLTYDIPTGEASVAGINDVISDGSLPSYYNLQGIKADKPKQGEVYIRVQGSTRTKVIF